MKFSEYYQVYLTYHTKPLTKIIHAIGNLATVAYIWLCLLYCWWGLVLSPFIIYIFAWPSHWWVERNKPAAFRHPILAKMADWRMMWDLIRGKGW